MLFICRLIAFAVAAQSDEANLSQKIKGTIIDADSKKLLLEATIVGDKCKAGNTRYTTGDNETLCRTTAKSKRTKC